jgi:VCBS repeat-containing protein
MTLKKLVTAALFVALAATAASAETLMMPKRDGTRGQNVIVWGVSTLPNGSPYTLNFGDGTSVSGNVADRSYIAFAHNYATAGTFTARLRVGAEEATVEVRILDPATLPGGPAGEAARGLRINMAIEDGLRWFWVNQESRSANFPVSSVTTWPGSTWRTSYSALAALAFENHGYKLPNDNSAPTGLYEKYIVQRALNYVVSALVTLNIAPEAAGNPCQGLGPPPLPASCVALAERRHDTFHESYTTGVAMLPLAASGALMRINTAGNPGTTGFSAGNIPNYTVGKTYGEILQRMSNALVWGQANSGVARGGWYYNFNAGSMDGSTVGWDLLALLDAAAAGIVVPAFSKTEFAFGLAGSLNTNGTLDYQGNGDAASMASVGPAKNGVGLQGLFYIGETTGARVDAVVNTINSWWSGAGGIGGNAWGGPGNKGGGYAMFNNFKGLKLAGITTLPAVTRPAGPGAIPAGDWYADYQDWLVANQTTPNTLTGGNWGTMSFSCCDNTAALNNAIAELILSPVALVLPDADKFASVGLRPATASGVESTPSVPRSHTVIARAEGPTPPGSPPGTEGPPVAGATVIFQIISGPNVGSTFSAVTAANGEVSWTYTDSAVPFPSFGTDRIRASIGTLQSNIAEMTWTPFNRPPVANDDSFPVDEDGTLDGNVLTNDTDPDGDPLTVALVGSGPANGTLDLNSDGTFTYTPNANFCGSDGFSYDANDTKVDSNVATVTITVRCVNDAPVAVADSNSTDEDTPVGGSVANDTDIENDTLSYGGASDPANGSVSLNGDGTYNYAPDANFNGTDTFTYTVSDGNGGTATGTVTITVAPVNDAPAASNDSNATLEDTPVTGSVATNDTDVDGDALSYGGASDPANGSVTLNADGSYSYAPDANWSGTDTFTYMVSDGNGGAATGTVTITVAPVNDAPVCSAAAPSIGSLWPPDHGLTAIEVFGVVDPVEQSAITIKVTDIFQDEPTNTIGDGNTLVDGFGVGTPIATVRRERSGSKRVPGDGRMYYISFTGTDAEGGECIGTVTVGVPHDLGKDHEIGAGGPIYRSTGQ